MTGFNKQPVKQLRIKAKIGAGGVIADFKWIKGLHRLFCWRKKNAFHKKFQHLMKCIFYFLRSKKVIC